MGQVTNAERIEAWYQRAAEHLASNMGAHAKAYLGGKLFYVDVTENVTMLTRLFVQKFWAEYR